MTFGSYDLCSCAVWVWTSLAPDLPGVQMVVGSKSQPFPMIKSLMGGISLTATSSRLHVIHSQAEQ